jgi:hypothetical protein
MIARRRPTAPPPRSEGGEPAKPVEGANGTLVVAPSTTLRVVPLPRCAGEELV